MRFGGIVWSNLQFEELNVFSKRSGVGLKLFSWLLHHAFPTSFTLPRIIVPSSTESYACWTPSLPPNLPFQQPEIQATSPLTVIRLFCTILTLEPDGDLQFHTSWSPSLMSRELCQSEWKLPSRRFGSRLTAAGRPAPAFRTPRQSRLQNFSNLSLKIWSMTT